MSQFEFGPLARGIYMSLMWATLVVVVLILEGIVRPWFILFYAGFLLFLGLGLRPLLEKTGLHLWFLNIWHRIEERLHRDITEDRRFEVDKSRRDFKLKNSRSRHPDLPKNW